MKVLISRIVTTFFTSQFLRDMKRRIHALRRQLRGGSPTIHFFYQSGDPYSYVAAQALTPICDRYKVKLVNHLVSPPDDAAAPEREKLREYAMRDAGRLAQEYGFAFPMAAVAPDAMLIATARAILVKAIDDGRFNEIAPQVGHALWEHDEKEMATISAAHGQASAAETEAALAEGTNQRHAMGHYLSGMFYFEGEWYWGIDRLHHLETRLQSMGLDREPQGTPGIAPYRDIELGDVPTGGAKPVIEVWFSFRSPYSYIHFPRIRKLAHHYGAELKLRFILPMVMRGLPVPRNKRLYITLDTKREADMGGIRYGTIVDPVGAGAARALAVLHHAVKLGKGEEFAELGMQAPFADGIDLASDSGMYDVGKRAGLNKAEVKAALADKSWEAMVEKNREALFAAGLWGAPSFRVNGMPAHWGQDRLWALEADIREVMGANAAPV